MQPVDPGALSIHGATICHLMENLFEGDLRYCATLKIAMSSYLISRSKIKLRHKESGLYLFGGKFRARRNRASDQFAVGVTSHADDDSTTWIVKRAHEWEGDGNPGSHIGKGEVIRLENAALRANLHSHSGGYVLHDGKAEATCFGRLGEGDSNDNWELNFDDQAGVDNGSAITLRHLGTNDWLQSSDVDLRPRESSDIAPPDAKQVGVAGQHNRGAWEVVTIDGGVAVDSEPLLILRFAGNEPDLAVYRLEDVQRWLDRELIRWKWRESLGHNSEVSHIKQAIDSKLSPLRHLISHARNAVDTDGLPKELEEISTHVESLFREGNWIHSNSAIARFVNRLAETDSVAALYALAAALQIDFELYSRASAKGFFAVQQFEAGLSPGYSDDQRAAFEQVISGIGRMADSMRDRIESHQTSFDTLRTNAAGRIDNLFISTDGKLEGISQRANTTIVEAQGKVDAFLKAAKEQWPIEASVTYWAQRTSTHRKIAGWCAGGLALIGAAAFFIVRSQLSKIGEVSSSLRPISSSFTQTLFAPSMTPLYFQYVILILLISALVWPAKIVVRIMLSHMQQASESYERTTMVKTFIALIADGSIKDLSEKKILLETLFRPGNTALLSDDSGPATPIEILLKNVRN